MQLSEMQGLLAGKCLPGDMKVNETHAEYFLRKFNQVNELVAENVALKSVLHPIANEHSDCESTDRPVWYVVNPSQMMRANASNVCSMFHGPFWSRERANQFLENTRYRYGDKVSVYCKSLYHSPAMRTLYDASKNLVTPATDAAIAEIKAQGVDELIQSLSVNGYMDESEPLIQGEIIEFAANLRAGRKG